MNKFFAYLFCSFALTACPSFPYQGVIEESTRYVTKNNPQAFQSLTFENETFSFFRTANPGKPLVLFIHGSPGSWEASAHFFKSPRLRKNFELIAFDRMGYGKNRPGVPYGKLEDQIKIPLAIINQFSEGRAVFVVGHSYGGPVAIKLAQAHPEKVQGLLLLAAALDPQLEEELWYQSVAKIWGLRWLIPDDLDVCNRE
ncbi:MAG: alpha/beta hydrolase, partial [Pseudomonadota bacterium]